MSVAGTKRESEREGNGERKGEKEGEQTKNYQRKGSIQGAPARRNNIVCSEKRRRLTKITKIMYL